MDEKLMKYVECAVCAAYGLTAEECLTPLDTAVEVPRNVDRDGLGLGTVYICPECASQASNDEDSMGVAFK